MKLTLYSAPNCHLCDVALDLIEPFLPSIDGQLEKVNIKTDPQLYHLYAVRIPVLKRQDNQQELGWPFDQQTLANFLK